MHPSISCAMVAAFLAGPAVCQEPGAEQVVTLEIVPVEAPNICHAIQFGTKTTGAICAAGSPVEGRGPGDVLVRAEATDTPQTYKLTVDTDCDGKLEGEPALLVGKDRPAEYMLRGKFRFQVRFDQDGAAESLLVYALYRAEGRVRTQTRELLVVVQDLQADADFDAADLRQGTALGIDTDNDGRIWGAHEYFSAGQVMAVGGKHLLADVRHFTAERLEIRFVETKLAIADVGQQVPSFTMHTLSGREVTPASLRGKPFVLDFWASWCAPCVAKLPAMKQLAEARGKGEPLEVFYFTVDDATRMEAARAAAEKHALPKDRVVASGLSDQDPTWQAFGSMRRVRMMIPAYVLVDADGVIRYAGNGGDKLVQLQAAVAQLAK